jgi:2-C-methyl-D-erythritol 4-phosphate cytidylyltransferase
MSKISDFIRRKKGHPFCSVVVVAAGSSQRMGQDKLMLELGGLPVLARTLRALNRCSCIDEIVVVTRSEKIMDIAHLCQEYDIEKVTKIVCGGMTRTESALAGLSEIDERARLAAIHDGARPLVTPGLVAEVTHAAALYKAAAPAVPVKDTVKLAEDGVVTDTPDRRKTVAVQTPQVFMPELIKAALTDAIQKELVFTDDCSAVEALGVKVHLTSGSEENIKVTTPLDMELAETILKGRRDYV